MSVLQEVRPTVYPPIAESNPGQGFDLSTITQYDQNLPAPVPSYETLLMLRSEFQATQSSLQDKVVMSRTHTGPSGAQEKDSITLTKEQCRRALDLEYWKLDKTRREYLLGIQESTEGIITGTIPLTDEDETACLDAYLQAGDDTLLFGDMIHDAVSARLKLHDAIVQAERAERIAAMSHQEIGRWLARTYRDDPYEEVPGEWREGGTLGVSEEPVAVADPMLHEWYAETQRPSRIARMVGGIALAARKMIPKRNRGKHEYGSPDIQ